MIFCFLQIYFPLKLSELANDICYLKTVNAYGFDGLMTELSILFIDSTDHTMCSGSVVVTAYDSESGRPGSNPEWGLLYYTASITAQGSPEPSSLHWVPEQLNTKAETGACKLIDGCSLALCSATVSVVSAGICHIHKVNSIA